MADVSASLKNWSTTASSNNPGGSTVIGAGLDDNLREIQAVVRQLAASDTIASAATTDIGSKDSTFLTISGTTTITSLGTVSAGIWKWCVFGDALTLTHNATSLILPGGANITTAAGDIAKVLSLGSGNWRCLLYQRVASSALQNQSGTSVTITGGSITGITDLAIADGGTAASTAANAFTNLKQDASDTATGVLEIAVQSEMETGTSTTLAVTPGRQHFHPSAAKAWGSVTGAGVLNTGYNCTSARTGTGTYSITFTNALSSANYSVVISGSNVGGTGNTLICWTAKLAGSFGVISTGASFGSVADAPFDFAVYGDI